MVSPSRHWFEFRLLGADLSDGVDVRALTRLMTDLSVALRVIADERLGLGERRGPMTAEERVLAGIRIVAVAEGSVSLRFRPPPEIGHQLDFRTIESTPENVIEDFIAECRASGENGPTSSRRGSAVAQVLRSASRIGDSAVLRHIRIDGEEIEAKVVFDDAWALPAQDAVADIAQRIIIGHVYMVDVELGRQRLRVKLPNEADITLDVDDVLVPSVAETIDRLVELHVSEATVNGRIVERVVGSYELLPTVSMTELHPPKSLLMLAMERGLLLGPPPDYAALCTEIWRSTEEVEEFASYLHEVRSGTGA